MMLWLFLMAGLFYNYAMLLNDEYGNTDCGIKFNKGQIIE